MAATTKIIQPDGLKKRLIGTIKAAVKSSAVALLSLAGCASITPVASPKNTSDAVREMTVALAGQCKTNEVAQGADFKACFNQQLDAAVEQIKRYQKCVSPVGCKPNSEQ